LEGPGLTDRGKCAFNPRKGLLVALAQLSPHKTVCPFNCLLRWHHGSVIVSLSPILSLRINLSMGRPILYISIRSSLLFSGRRSFYITMTSLTEGPSGCSIIIFGPIVGR